MPSRTQRALALVLALLLAGCFGKEKGQESDSEATTAADDDDSAEAEVEDAVPVRVHTLTTGDASQRIATSATVDSDQRADILVEANGTVENIAVEEGARVGKDQILATLRNPQLKGEFDRARSEFERAEQEFESMKSLFDKGFVAKNEYDTAAHAFQTAKLTFEQSREAYAARELRSPIAGTVSMRDLRFGEAVSPPKLAFQVVDLRKLKVDLSLPERDLSRVKVGQPARIRTEVLEGLEIPGHVQRISPVVDPATGTVKVTVAVDPGQEKLRPGMFVNVDIVVDTHANAVLLPKRALVYAEGKPYVFAVVGEGEAAKAERRAVELGFTEEDQAEVLSGVEAGERVIVVGQSTLRDGSRVEVRAPEKKADDTEG